MLGWRGDSRQAPGDFRLPVTSPGSCSTAGLSVRLSSFGTSTGGCGIQASRRCEQGLPGNSPTGANATSFWPTSGQPARSCLDRLCRGRGVSYYHFLQPNQYLAGSKPILEDEKQIAIVEGHPYGQGVARGYPLLIRRRERSGKRVSCTTISPGSSPIIPSRPTSTTAATITSRLRDHGRRDRPSDRKRATAAKPSTIWPAVRTFGGLRCLIDRARGLLQRSMAMQPIGLTLNAVDQKYGPSGSDPGDDDGSHSG